MFFFNLLPFCTFKKIPEKISLKIAPASFPKLSLSYYDIYDEFLMLGIHPRFKGTCNEARFKIKEDKSLSIVINNAKVCPNRTFSGLEKCVSQKSSWTLIDLGNVYMIRLQSADCKDLCIYTSGKMFTKPGLKKCDKNDDKQFFLIDKMNKHLCNKISKHHRVKNNLEKNGILYGIGDEWRDERERSEMKNINDQMNGLNDIIKIIDPFSGFFCDKEGQNLLKRWKFHVVDPKTKNDDQYIKNKSDNTIENRKKKVIDCIWRKYSFLSSEKENFKRIQNCMKKFSSKNDKKYPYKAGNPSKISKKSSKKSKRKFEDPQKKSKSDQTSRDGIDIKDDNKDVNRDKKSDKVDCVNKNPAKKKPLTLDILNRILCSINAASSKELSSPDFFQKPPMSLISEKALECVLSEFNSKQRTSSVLTRIQNCLRKRTKKSQIDSGNPKDTDNTFEKTQTKELCPKKDPDKSSENPLFEDESESSDDSNLHEYESPKPSSGGSKNSSGTTTDQEETDGGPTTPDGSTYIPDDGPSDPKDPNKLPGGSNSGTTDVQDGFDPNINNDKKPQDNNNTQNPEIPEVPPEEGGSHPTAGPFFPREEEEDPNILDYLYSAEDPPEYPSADSSDPIDQKLLELGYDKLRAYSTDEKFNPFHFDFSYTTGEPLREALLHIFTSKIVASNLIDNDEISKGMENKFHKMNLMSLEGYLNDYEQDLAQMIAQHIVEKEKSEPGWFQYGGKQTIQLVVKPVSELSEDFYDRLHS